MQEMAYQSKARHRFYPWKKTMSQAERNRTIASAKALQSEYLQRQSRRKNAANALNLSSADRIKMDHLIRKIGAFDGDKKAVLKLIDIYRKNDPATLTKLLLDYRYPVFAENSAESNAIRVCLVSGKSLFRGEPPCGSPRLEGGRNDS